MNTHKVTAMYVQYVQDCIAAKCVPQSFDVWDATRIAELNRAKPFSINLTSHRMNGDVTFHVSAKNESEAYQEAQRLLANLEYRYSLETDSTGKELTIEQQIEKLKNRIAADERALERKIQAARKRIAKYNSDEETN